MIDKVLEVRTAYASDSSGLSLIPEAVARPASQDEVMDVLKMANCDSVPITAAGSQTSTTGSSISDKGIILSTKNLNKIIDIDIPSCSIRVEPGVLIGNINAELKSLGVFFAPDPTSANECSIGGAIACNASGPRSLVYGATQRHVRSLKVGLIDGRVVTLKRSALEKNTVGYIPTQDLVDWFIGSEGTLGVILEAELSLQVCPQHEFGILIPFRNEISALGFIIECRRSSQIIPRSLEYFDSAAVRIVQSSNIVSDNLSSDQSGAAVYAEFTADLDSSLDRIEALIEKHGGNLNEVKVFQGEAALRMAQKIRHEVPAAIIEQAASFRSLGGRRISTDWAVPYDRLPALIRDVREAAGAFKLREPVIFGHAGNGHPHCNYIGRNSAEVHRIESMLSLLLKRVIAAGGTIAAEHGIGKIKNQWMALQFSTLQFQLLRSIKSELDPRNLLAPGNILVTNP